MKSKDNKTALKLLEKYAESHENLQRENKMLKNMLDDYKKNLNINKNIINSLLSEQTKTSSNLDFGEINDLSNSIINSRTYASNNISNNATNNNGSSNKKSNTSDHNNLYIINNNNNSINKEKEVYISLVFNLQEENSNLSKLLDSNLQEIENLRNKLYVTESIAIDRSSDVTKQNENYKNKVFVLENLLTKKDNQIKNYKDKYESILNISEEKNLFDKEIIVVDPTVSILSYNEELLNYKNSYINLIEYCNKLKNSIVTTEKANNRLLDENSNLKLYIREKNKQNYANTLMLQQEISKRTTNIPEDNKRSYSSNIRYKESNLNNSNKMKKKLKDYTKNNLYKDEEEDRYEKLTNDIINNYGGKNFLENVSKRKNYNNYITSDNRCFKVADNVDNNNNDNNNHINYKKNNSNKSIISSYSANVNNEILNKVKPIYNDDWCEAVKLAGLTIVEVESLKENKNSKLNIKIAEAFEVFNQVINDKDVHIDVLLAENEKINTEILGLLNEIKDLKLAINNLNKELITKYNKIKDNESTNTKYLNTKLLNIPAFPSASTNNALLYSSKNKLRIKGKNKIDYNIHKLNNDIIIKDITNDKNSILNIVKENKKNIFKSNILNNNKFKIINNDQDTSNNSNMKDEKISKLNNSSSNNNYSNSNLNNNSNSIKDNKINNTKDKNKKKLDSKVVDEFKAEFKSKLFNKYKCESIKTNSSNKDNKYNIYSNNNILSSNIKTLVTENIKKKRIISKNKDDKLCNNKYSSNSINIINDKKNLNKNHIKTFMSNKKTIKIENNDNFINGEILYDNDLSLDSIKDIKIISNKSKLPDDNNMINNDIYSESFQDLYNLSKFLNTKK